MTTHYFILTAAQSIGATTFASESVTIDPRLIDGETPGNGINLNEQAEGVALSEAVPLADKYVVPHDILDDLGEAETAAMLTLPSAELDDAVIFAA
jgi:hypothetical protein